MVSVGFEPAIPTVKQLQACLRSHGQWDQLGFDRRAKCLQIDVVYIVNTDELHVIGGGLHQS